MKTNIIYDGNYIFHKIYRTWNKYKDPNPARDFDSIEKESKFVKRVISDIVYSIDKLPIPSKVIIARDAKSWRRDYYKEYKLREGDDIDWSNFYKIMDEVGEHLESMGYIFSKCEGAEGDDIIWGWAKEFLDKGENLIIIGDDRDLTQLVEMREGGNWCIMWNSKVSNSSVFVPENWKERYLNKQEEISLFNMGGMIDLDKEILNKLVGECKVIEINTKEFIFLKILMGDDGDNVPSVWSHHPKDKVRPIRVTPSRALKIWESFKNSNYKESSFDEILNNEEILEWISGQVLKNTKDIDNTYNRNLVIENIYRNFDLMWLNKKSYPDYILENISNEVEEKIEKHSSKLEKNLKRIIEGSKWNNINLDDNTPDELNPFEFF